MEDYGGVASLVASGVVLWSTAFLLLRALLPKRSYDFCNRAVSTMHAVAGVALGCLSVQDWASPVSPVASPSSPSQMRALAVTLSYMIYDGACCHLSGDARLDNALHHLISIVGLAAGLAYQRCGTELVACLLVTEISSPLLHLREMLKELGVKDTDLNLLVDILFAVTFSVARMVCGTYVTYRTVTADNPILIKAMATSLLLVSAYWFLRILRMVRHKIGKKRLASKAAGKESM
ncbi:TLC domain-containing protein 5-like [Triticum urartu]|uniref:TLC domain-containing protein n=3 Tax=Triticum TaxID=4564 RepID=A0A9R0VI64_TRITD|nr:TLC domain-containing protein 5-like [Triticum dicoccoides]XP_044339845.1 TLC domain-containing protein 5-like [Triticum aestivum]XP_048562912.1 TLC domain-containing protein 5-like [Triticum urartu]VAH59950.1 unnamed protein product [Triticum turgidum subsp. durum]